MWLEHQDMQYVQRADFFTQLLKNLVVIKTQLIGVYKVERKSALHGPGPQALRFTNRFKLTNAY